MSNRLVDPDCPFCPANGKVDIIADHPDAYLVQAKGTGGLLPGAYFAIPKAHLPDEPHWMTGVIPQLIYRSGLGITIDNKMINLTERGGRRVMGHFHAWLIDRHDDLGIGGYSLIQEVLRLRARVVELEAEIAALSAPRKVRIAVASYER
jgi:hypothetical protein